MSYCFARIMYITRLRIMAMRYVVALSKGISHLGFGVGLNWNDLVKCCVPNICGFYRSIALPCFVRGCGKRCHVAYV